MQPAVVSKVGAQVQCGRRAEFQDSLGMVKTYLKKKWGALRSEVVQAVGCLPCRQEDLNLILRIHILKVLSRVVVAHAFHPSTREAEAGKSL